MVARTDTVFYELVRHTEAKAPLAENDTGLNTLIEKLNILNEKYAVKPRLSTNERNGNMPESIGVESIYADI